MGMQFTVSITGKAVFTDLDASDVGIEADAVVSGEVGYSNSVSFEDARVTSGTVTIEARAQLEDHEVSAEDLDGFDGTEALESAIDSYNVSVEDIEFEVTDSPTGFEAVESAIGRDEAISAYAALASNGFEVV